MNLILAALLSVLALPAFAQAPAAQPAKKSAFVVPIFSQSVMFHAPEGYVPVHENKDAARGHHLVEYIPKDQTLQNWRDMVTVQGYRGAAAKAGVTPLQLIAMFGSQIQSVCKADFIVQPFGEGRVDGLDMAFALIGCGRLPTDLPGGLKAGQSEISVYAAIKGSQDMYLVHRSVRGRGISAKDFPRQELATWISPIGPFRLCAADKPADCTRAAAR